MIRRLYLRRAMGDLRQNPGVTIALMTVLALSAFLLSSGAMVMERLAGSVGQMFSVAKPPHFLQMHTGEYDREALDSFAAERSDIDSWVVQEMLGNDGQLVSWTKQADGSQGDLSESQIDNLFVTQNPNFDFLLNADDDSIPTPAAGEVFIPVAVAQQFELSIGDTLTVQTDEKEESFRVAGAVRDAQMASSMSSATRFLISDKDFDHLLAAGGASPEIMVEYRLTDGADLASFQRAYESDSALPKNGQAVTGVMIRIINMLSDGLVAIAFAFAAFLLIVIALLNARFVIRGSLEDEIHEIGAMRAIGLPPRTIARLYLSQYAVITLVACLLGGALSTIAISGFTASIRANFSEAPVTAVTILVPLAALAAMFFIVIGICARTLRQVARADVVGALIHGISSAGKRAEREARRGAKRVSRSLFSRARPSGIGARLVLRDLRAERRDWAILPLVFFLVAILVTIPLNLLTTFESPRFVTYLGAPDRDLRVDINFVEDGDAVSANIRSTLEQDSRVTAVYPYAGMLYEIQGEEGWEVFRVEVGDYTDTSLAFATGHAPGEGEIALSTLNAEKYGLRPGDSLTVKEEESERTVTVSGVYQDVTSGGYTAKLQGNVGEHADRWTIYADLASGTDPQEIAREYQEQYQDAAVLAMQSYLSQTLSYIIGSLRAVALITLAFGIGTAALITVLFLRLRLTKDRTKVGVLTTLGFSAREIIAQFRAKALLLVAVGTVLGTLFAATLGEQIISALLSASGTGIRQLSFIPNPWLSYLGYPALLLATGAVGAIILTRTLRHTNRSEWLR
ncbi:ABC transporter permease [Microbacterium amylolyticum]|uniref:ABC transport system permease protein n=1 Tax=Microbacterium amylolyticum TaxID=936337 RepID=A0ABS4ZI41_9MICO|nr:ABC transporter permease [Microbacterium amylolyticum]MBP2436945.1 putative ABC transport system permease protein [Microbacterium amylolyticum]